jgi:hypothetical protein
VAIPVKLYPAIETTDSLSLAAQEMRQYLKKRVDVS